MAKESTPVKASRVTTWKRIDDLIKLNVINTHPDPANRQTKLLALNDDSMFNLSLDELRAFERSFFRLVSRLIQTLRKQGRVEYGSEQAREIVRLMHNVFEMYYVATDSIHFSSRTIWPQMIQDPDELKKLYGLVFSRLAAIQSRLSQEWASADNRGFLRSYESAKQSALWQRVPLLTTEVALWHKYGVEKECRATVNSLSNFHFLKATGMSEKDLIQPA